MLQYHAVILASGKGSRLGALTANKPKCLLPLGSETIIERQIRLLQDSGVSRITMIVGYRRDALAAGRPRWTLSRGLRGLGRSS